MPRPGIPDESEDDTELSSEDEEAQQDPEAARESLLVAAAITDPSVFSVEQKKSQKAQALSRSTGWSHEQLVGWYRMFQNNVSLSVWTSWALVELTWLIVSSRTSSGSSTHSSYEGAKIAPWRRKEPARPARSSLLEPARGKITRGRPKTRGKRDKELGTGRWQKGCFNHSCCAYIHLGQN